MSRNPRTPLSPRERELLDHLEQWVDGRDDPRTREAIIDYLTAKDFDEAEVQRLLNQLRLKGYIYELDDGIRVTDPGARD